MIHIFAPKYEDMQSKKIKEGTDLNSLQTVAVFTSTDFPTPQLHYDETLTMEAWNYMKRLIQATGLILLILGLQQRYNNRGGR